MYGTPIDVCVGVQILDKSELISIFFFYDAVFRISIQSRCDQNGFRQFRERVCNHRCSDSLFNNELSLSLSLLPEKATLHRRCVLFERRERHWKMVTFPRSMCTRMSPMISHVQRELQEAEADAGVCGY